MFTTLLDLTGLTPRKSLREEPTAVSIKTATTNKSTAVAPEEATEARPIKQQKQCIMDDLTCPISGELPIDPVHAADGRLYDREAIMMHFATTTTGLTSPLTREPMTRKLFPAHHITSIIEKQINDGSIDGELATNWLAGRKDLMKDKETNRQLPTKANTGDAEAMILLGVAYEQGSGCHPKDPKKAVQWYQKAHNAGSVKGTAYLGDAYCTGLGVDQDIELGVAFYFEAAQKGSDFAAHFLGMTYAEGNYGFPQNLELAKAWLQKCVAKCDVEHMDHEEEEEAHKTLEKLDKDQ
jgi:Sel1 repeat/U-box domain